MRETERREKKGKRKSERDLICIVACHAYNATFCYAYIQNWCICICCQYQRLNRMKMPLSWCIRSMDKLVFGFAKHFSSFQLSLKTHVCSAFFVLYIRIHWSIMLGTNLRGWKQRTKHQKDDKETTTQCNGAEWLESMWVWVDKLHIFFFMKLKLISCSRAILICVRASILKANKRTKYYHPWKSLCIFGYQLTFGSFPVFLSCAMRFGAILFKFTIVFTKLECKFGKSQNIFFIAFFIITNGILKIYFLPLNSNIFLKKNQIVFVFVLYNTKYLKALEILQWLAFLAKNSREICFEMRILLFSFVFNEGVINYIDISIRKIA